MRLYHEGEQHLPALFDRLAQERQACLLAVFSAPQFFQHSALQPFPFELQRHGERYDIEVAGGQIIIELQGIDTLRGARGSFTMPVYVIIAFQRLDILHGVKKQGFVVKVHGLSSSGYRLLL